MCYGSKLGDGKLIIPANLGNSRWEGGEEDDGYDEYGKYSESSHAGWVDEERDITISQDDSDDDDDDSSIDSNGEQLNPCEIVSELLNAGKSLREIAGYDTVQLIAVLWRKRDKYGALIRSNGLPPGVEVDSDGMRTISNPAPFQTMFRQVKRRRQGMSIRDADLAWEQYLAQNPKLGKGGV